MRTLVLTFNHKNTPFELLGRIAIREREMPTFLAGVGAELALREVVCVSTCNRTDVYCVADSASTARRLVIEEIARWSGVPESDLSERALVLEGAECWRHLLATAAGIGSLIVGEVEVLGQVRRAWEMAEASGTGGRVLRDLFQRALQVGRRARRETRISRGNLSVASAALGMLRERIEDLAGARVLVVGTGELGRQLMRLLAQAGVRSPVLVSRSRERAEAAAREAGGTPTAMEGLAGALAHADIVLCACGAAEPVLTEAMARAVGGRRVVVDLSAPRNVEPGVAGVEGYTVFTIADLEDIARANSAQRHGDVRRVVEMIDTEIARLEEEAGALPRQELVRAFRLQAETVRARHAARFGGRLGGENREELERYSRSLVSALLHGIVANIHQLPLEDGVDGDALEVARRLLLQPAGEEAVVLRTGN
jgi:glutamyl-tRNA reductase